MKTNIRMKEIMSARDAICVMKFDAEFAKKYRPAKYEAACERVRAAEAEFNTIAEPLSATIKEAEGRASERCLTARSVVLALESINKNLNIPAKHMRGIKARVCPKAQDFPRAYKYTPMASVFYAEYKSSGWVITAIDREKCPRASQEYYIELTEEAKAAIIDRISRNK